MFPPVTSIGLWWVLTEDCIIPLNDIHHKTMNNVASQTPNDVRPACEEWRKMLFMNPSDERDKFGLNKISL